MAQAVMIIGQSGTGKSTSARTLPPSETFWINPASKPLPFPGWKKGYTELSSSNPKGNLLNSGNFSRIAKAIQGISENENFKHIKYVVVDDLR